jgi:hypothetical protein
MRTRQPSAASAHFAPLSYSAMASEIQTASWFGEAFRLLSVMSNQQSAAVCILIIGYMFLYFLNKLDEAKSLRTIANDRRAASNRIARSTR